MARRPVFQEVTDTTPRTTPPQGGMIDAGHRGARGAIRLWLITLFLLVVAMIVVGGLTGWRADWSVIRRDAESG